MEALRKLEFTSSRDVRLDAHADPASAVTPLVLANITAAAKGDSTFVAVAASGTGNRAMVLSTDPRTDLLSIDGSSPRMDIVSPNLSITATSTTIQGNLAVTKVTGTTNSLNWTTLNSPAANQWTSITYGNGQFVAVSSTGVGNPDGNTWTSRKSPADNTWECVAYGNLTFVAVSSTGTQRVMTSSDGVTGRSGRAFGRADRKSCSFQRTFGVPPHAHGPTRGRRNPYTADWAVGAQSA